MRLQAEVGWKVGGDETRGPRVHEEGVDGQTETGRQDAKGSYCTRVR